MMARWGGEPSLRCPAYAQYLSHWPMPTEDEWSAALATSRILAHQSRSDFDRFADVIARFAKAFRIGRIKTALDYPDSTSVLPQPTDMPVVVVDGRSQWRATGFSIRVG
jgi:hypothetical protein